MTYRFTWDRAKAASNRRKHGVTFEEATTVVDNELAAHFDDVEHGEQRYNAIGHSSRGRLLFVVYAVHAREIRIISARGANKHERKRYEEASE